MMRYRGTFQRSKYPITAVDAEDEGAVLEKKWESWVEREQWKRLVVENVRNTAPADSKPGSSSTVMSEKRRRP